MEDLALLEVGEGLSGEKGKDEEARGDWTAPMSKSFERLTSGQMGSPKTQDLREQGRKSTACSLSAGGQKERRKEGCCEPTG